MRYVERTDNFVGSVYFPAICHLPEWGEFLINVEVIIEIDNQQHSKVFQFKHTVTKRKSYGLYFWDVMSSA
jgi:hypothetical protein